MTVTAKLRERGKEEIFFSRAACFVAYDAHLCLTSGLCNYEGAYSAVASATTKKEKKKNKKKNIKKSLMPKRICNENGRQQAMPR